MKKGLAQPGSAPRRHAAKTAASIATGVRTRPAIDADATNNGEGPWKRGRGTKRSRILILLNCTEVASRWPASLLHVPHQPKKSAGINDRRARFLAFALARSV